MSGLKGIAVPYVIALILGIIVVGVIGYWFFVVAGGGGGTASSVECQGYRIAYCTDLNSKGNIDGANEGEFVRKYPRCASLVPNPIEIFGKCREVLSIPQA